MKSLLQNLGVILVIIGAVILIASYATGNVNDNTVLGVSLLVVVAGLISYIILNKELQIDFFQSTAIKKPECLIQAFLLLTSETPLFTFRSNQFISLSVNIDNLN